MKNNFIEKCKNTLGNKIDDFIRNNSNYKGKKARIKFVESVNKLLNIDNFDEQSNYKKVSRWISGEVFPDFITVIAISKVMGVSLDELFNDNIASLSKLNELSIEEKRTLKKLIANADKEDVSSMYIPYAFKEKQLCANSELFTREEVINLYKEKANKVFLLDRFNLYNSLSQEKVIQKNEEKHFVRFCSVEFIESSKLELPKNFYLHKDGYEYSSPECILYTNTDEYYKKISKIWERYNNNNFYNVIFFDEWQCDYNENNLSNVDKAYFYKTKAIAESTYNKYFLSLIKKGLLTPVKIDFLDEYNKAFGFEQAENKETSNNINIGKFITFFTDDEHEYSLETISFSFKINLSKIEMQELLRSNV